MKYYDVRAMRLPQFKKRHYVCRSPSEIFSGTFSCLGPCRQWLQIHYHRRRELSSREDPAIPRCRACSNLRDLQLSRAYIRIVQIRSRRDCYEARFVYTNRGYVQKFILTQKILRFTQKMCLANCVRERSRYL